MARTSSGLAELQSPSLSLPHALSIAHPPILPAHHHPLRGRMDPQKKKKEKEKDILKRISKKQIKEE